MKASMLRVCTVTRMFWGVWRSDYTVGGVPDVSEKRTASVFRVEVSRKIVFRSYRVDCLHNKYNSNDAHRGGSLQLTCTFALLIHKLA
jgi:hypothetical protein